jgi:tetratricopeptide (TPR) repeat protein
VEADLILPRGLATAAILFSLSLPVQAGDKEDCVVEGNEERAVAACTALIDGGASGADLAQALFVRANALGILEKLDEAEADIRKAVELEPGNAQYHFGLGNFYLLAKSEYEQAIAEYDKAIELKPDFALAYFSRGYVFEAQRKFAEALASYKKASELDPDDVNASRAAENMEATMQSATPQ